ncbi:hypothetical protein KCP74_02950 [Salmonella enterica subsp. enterica]|nr:hypothetical protein KCP74_02950 [Salmonella enterica subsp. enterica]
MILEWHRHTNCAGERSLRDSRGTNFAVRRPRSSFPVCFLICRANIMTKSWRITGEAGYRISSARGINVPWKLLPRGCKGACDAFRIKIPS